ncbi:phosphoadenosine phosphosulfate reductase family protein, partial [Ostertagia ostertagi]
FTLFLHAYLRLRLSSCVSRKYGPDVQIQGFHIMVEDQFPEATQFIIDAARNYNIVVTEYPGPLKSGLEALKKEQPNVVAVLMGSRGTDPHGKYMKSPVEWTDPDWPKVLRVCPILAWSYRDVWMTLRELCIPYCPLYDMGYTSLGGRSTTVKNPLLKITGKDGSEKLV